MFQVVPLSKDKGLRDIGHSMITRNPILGVNSVTVSYLIHCNSLLQILTDIITKCGRQFITKCIKFFITKCDSFITKCDSLLQIAMILLQNATVITKCDICYVTVQTLYVSRSCGFSYAFASIIKLYCAALNGDMNSIAAVTFTSSVLDLYIYQFCYWIFVWKLLMI